MNDWWDYLEHGWLGKNGQKGSEKKNHKYYARVPTGTKDGHNVYRYFYSKEDYAAYIRSGKKKLTGEYGMEKHPNGRIAWTATEQYTDKDGKLQTRKTYVTADVAAKLRDDQYRREKAANETEAEKSKRMKDAKKRYNKKMSATRRKIAVQKGAQTISRIFGKQLTFKKKPETQLEKKNYKKAKWQKSLFIPGGYTRAAVKKK